MWGSGRVSSSYSTAEIKVAFEIQSDNDVQYIGGLIGRRQSSGLVVANSYWDINTSGQMNSPGGGIAQTTEDLKMPVTETDIYADWSTDDWDFGTSEEYPVLKYNDNTCGTLMAVARLWWVIASSAYRLARSKAGTEYR